MLKRTPWTLVAASWICSAVIARNAARVFAPAAVANLTPFCSASASGWGGRLEIIAPLSPIAPAIRPFESGEAISALTEIDPADSPAIGDALRIAAECRDVLLHPLEGGLLVEQPVVAGGVVRRFLRQFGMDEEAEDVGPVVDGHRDHAFAGHVLAVVARLRAVAVLEAAAEDIDEYRQFLVARLGGSPDVEVEAVLAHAVAAEPVVGAGEVRCMQRGPNLSALRTPRPVLDGLRLPPAKVADRRLAERDPLEAAHAVLGGGGGFQYAVGGLDAIRGDQRLQRGGTKNDDREERRGSLHRSINSWRMVTPK